MQLMIKESSKKLRFSIISENYKATSDGQNESKCLMEFP